MTDSVNNGAVPVLLTEEQHSAINRHAEAVYPDECCGVMLGKQRDGQRVIVELIEIENEWDAEERRRRFLITPQQMLRVEREARARDLDVLGFYHSHPDAPARPSEFDREHAWPFYSYLIAGVANGTAVELTGWQLHDDRGGYAPVELHEEG